MEFKHNAPCPPFTLHQMEQLTMTWLIAAAIADWAQYRRLRDDLAWATSRGD